MVSSHSFPLYFVSGFSGQKNLLITAVMDHEGFAFLSHQQEVDNNVMGVFFLYYEGEYNPLILLYIMLMQKLLSVIRGHKMKGFIGVTDNGRTAQGSWLRAKGKRRNRESAKRSGGQPRHTNGDRGLDISGNAAPEDGKKESTRLKSSCLYKTIDYNVPRIERRISGRFVMIPSTPIPIKRCISFRESGVHTNTWIPKLCAS
jgi:hypothetical protein